MILLDTQVWVWCTTHTRKLTKAARSAIENNDGLCVSAVSPMEAAYAHRRGRLVFEIPFERWLMEATSTAEISVVPLTPQLAVRAGQLDWEHGDPMDRAIVATALSLNARIVSSDYHVRRCPLIETLW